MDLISSETPQFVFFQGALGYNNGVYLMNDICKELYSKHSERIEARSVSLEDFEDEDLIKEGAKWKEARDAYTYKAKYGETKTYTGNNSYYPNLYAREIGAGINTEEINKQGLKQSDKGYTSLAEETYSPAKGSATDNSLIVTQTAYTVFIDKTNYGNAYSVLRNGTDYWLASRYALIYTSKAGFGVFTAGEYLGEMSGNALTNEGNMFVTSALQNLTRYHAHPLRPVVHLEHSVQLNLSDKATNASYPHKIIKY